jgi:hypothetical protein
MPAFFVAVKLKNAVLPGTDKPYRTLNRLENENRLRVDMVIEGGSYLLIEGSLLALI